MMKHNIFLEIILTISLVFVSCQKDEVVPVTSLSVDAMEIKTSYTTADIVWNVESEATINEVVLEYSTDSTFISAKEVRMSKPDKEANKYAAFLDSLENGTSYYIRCKAINKFNSTISKTDSLRTLAYQLAKVNTDSISSVTVSASKLHATLLEWGTDTIPQVGFCIASHSSVSIADSCILCPLSDIQDTISFAASIDNLIDNSTYYIRAFAKNNKGVSYGEELYFSTVEIVVPTVGETVVSNISYTTAQCRSNIIWEGGSSVTTCGFCYSTSDNPTTNDDKVLCSSKKFSSTLTGLSANTTYYIRAFATNCKGTAYGCATSFKTNAYSLPTVITSEVSNITYTTATCGGNVTDDGGQTVTERGICYSTSPNPTITDNIVKCKGGLGSYICNLTDLTAGTMYYIRAYAVNNIGTKYGEEVSFKTEYALPAIQTKNATNITFSSATCGGKIIERSIYQITEKGICYGKNPSPTDDNSKIISEVSTDDFSCDISGLDPNTKYYVRAYILYSGGKIYGEQIDFTTQAVIQDGKLPGIFSVSPTQKICFSQGNLKCMAKSKKWRFTEHQYDIEGNTSNVSQTYNGWMDLFGWGTSGFNNTKNDPFAINYKSWANSTNEINMTVHNKQIVDINCEMYSITGKCDTTWTWDEKEDINSANVNVYGYGPSTNQQDKDMTGTNANCDWGIYNAIENGGNQKGMWRTLSQQEWKYILYNRENAQYLRSQGTVCGVYGYILLPDDFILPDGLQWSHQSNNWSTNEYDAITWAKMEMAGAVFLPCAGHRVGETIYGIYSYGATHGYYWTCSHSSTLRAYIIHFTSNTIESAMFERYQGLSVRLVKDIK